MAEKHSGLRTPDISLVQRFASEGQTFFNILNICVTEVNPRRERSRCGQGAGIHTGAFTEQLDQEHPLNALKNVTTLTFDLGGTCLDLNGPLVPALADLLRKKGSKADAEDLRKQWRARQRIEQYQDTLISLGHSGYLETSRRALLYTLRQNNVPFDDVVPALECLKERYSLVALSNGNAEYLNHITKNRIGWEFDAVISCDAVGVFKPHPAVYRHAARELGLEPG